MAYLDRAVTILTAGLNRAPSNALKLRLAAAFGRGLPPDATMEERAEQFVHALQRFVIKEVDEAEIAQRMEDARNSGTAATDFAPTPP